MIQQKGWRTTRFIATVAACGALAFSAGAGLAAVETGPATMVLKTAEAKKPATFPHALHQSSLACQTCHHGMGADGSRQPLTEGATIGKCVSCHNPEMGNSALNSFKEAAHARCKSCHQEMKKAGEKTGPTACTGCHLK